MADISTLTSAIIKEAEDEAQKIIDSSRKKAEKLADEIKKSHMELIKKLENEAKSKNDLQHKSFESEKRKIYDNTRSAARMNFYYQVIEEAKAHLKNASAETHVSFVTKKLETLNIPDNSKISLSAKISDSDTSKICKKFNLEKSEKINDFGFIITTPNYKENYTLESIFEEKRPDFIKFLHTRAEVK